MALDGELHREVALKQILDSHADDPVSRHRFLMEAEITGGLEHPGIVPVYGLGTYADGRPYYAMRFIRGESLKEAIDRFHKDEALKKDSGRRSLELRKLLRRFIDVCNAIDYAHSRGVLHRDLKPGNIILGTHGETLVVDWGLAKPLDRVDPGSRSDERTLVPSSASGSSETLPGSALGTPGYMSPEQARGDLDRLSPRSDVYSLGATLYCLLTGRPPFEGDDVEQVLRKVKWGEFAGPRQLNRSIDPALEAVCLKAMTFMPEDRYPIEPGPGRRHRALDGRPAGRRLGGAVIAAVATLGTSVGRGGDTSSCWRDSSPWPPSRAAGAANRQAQKGQRRDRIAPFANPARPNMGPSSRSAESEESRKRAEAVRKFLIAVFQRRTRRRMAARSRRVDLLDRAAGEAREGGLGARTAPGQHFSWPSVRPTWASASMRRPSRYSFRRTTA